MTITFQTLCFIFTLTLSFGSPLPLSKDENKTFYIENLVGNPLAVSNGRRLLLLMGKTDKMDNFRGDGEDIGNIDLVHNSEKDNFLFPTTNQRFVYYSIFLNFNKFYPFLQSESKKSSFQSPDVSENISHVSSTTAIFQPEQRYNFFYLLI